MNFAQSTASAPTTETASPDSRGTEFVPVRGGGETTSAEALLVVAYALMWALVFGFVFTSFRRQLGLKARLDQLERSLNKSDAAPPKGP